MRRAETPDDDRFQALYDHHLEAVTRYCAGKVPESLVEDAVQETLIGILRSLDALPGDEERHRFWIIDHARTACKKVNRSRKRGEKAEAAAASGREGRMPDTGDHVIVQAELDDLFRSLGERSEIDRDIAWFRMLGYTSKEIGELLDMTPGAVDTRFSRLQARLCERGIVWEDRP